MTKDVFQYDMKMIKLFEADLLQDRIEFSKIEKNKMARYLRNTISATFIIPIIVLVIYFIVALFGLVLN